MDKQLPGFLPMLPIEGPPLPRFLEVWWPQGKPAQPEVASYVVKDAEIFFPGEKPPDQAPAPEPEAPNELDVGKEIILLLFE